MQNISDSPPRAPPIKYTAPLGTRWAKEKAAAGGAAAFDLPTDPKTIGPWILGECVGKGASGRVKIAKHRRTGQLAAVKILPVAPLVSSRASLATQQAKSDKQRLGIDREITMMKLMNHPNIMRIYDVYEGDKELFLVLEYVEGGELFDFLVNRGRLPPHEALIYFRQIVYGLNYAHTFSIIHRDLKPENILIASLSPPQIKIADWGMAAFAPPSLQLETSCGSPHYASPEIVNGQKYQGNATDIWSCGVILYALLTGRLPFDDKNVRSLLSKVKSGKYEMPTWIDPLAKDLLSKMLIVDVKQRITIPEILAHPWLVTHAAIPFCAPNGGAYTLLAPPLPPSPSILARPITAVDMIDAELFSSLRIIWGRHADALGEAIRRDLCAPAGHGVHAKAFYFLLGKYREGAYRNRTDDGVLGDDSQQTSSLSSASGVDVETETRKFNLGWELDHASGLRKYEVPKAHHHIFATPSSASSSTTTTAPPPPPPYSTHLSTGSPPAVVSSRKRTFTDGSLPTPMPMSPTTAAAAAESPRLPTRAQADAWKAHAQAQRESASASALPHTTANNNSNNARFNASVGAGRGGPRQFPPRRGHTYSAASASSAASAGTSGATSGADAQKHQHQHQHHQYYYEGVSSIGFSQHLQQLQARAASASASTSGSGNRNGSGSGYRPKSSAGPIAPFSEAEKRAKFASASASVNSPASGVDPATATAATATAATTSGIGEEPEMALPLLTAPKMENAQLQRTMDDITQKVNELVQAVTQAPAPSGSGGGVGGVGGGAEIQSKGHAHAHAHAHVRAVDEDKENQSIDEESWSHVSVSAETETETGRERSAGGGVLGLGVSARDRERERDVGNFRDVSNNPNPNPNPNAAIQASGSPTKPRKEVKERKGRPPPLELPSLNNVHARRTTLSAALGSPIALSSPIHPSSTAATRIMASPVVGEFKGWFSNLFNWKQSTGHGHGHGGVLYSQEDVWRTRVNVARVLDGMGVALVASSPSASAGGGGGGGENSNGNYHHHSAEQAEVLFCRVDQTVVDPATGTTLKNVRFRVEFRAGPGPSASGGGSSGGEHLPQQTMLLSPTVEEPSSYMLAGAGPSPSPHSSQLVVTPGHGNGNGGGSGSTSGPRPPRASMLLGRVASHSSSLPSPLAASKWELPPGCLCVIALVHEKGSMSTFRAVWRRLKEEYAYGGAGAGGGGGAAAGYPCFSPALPPTPYTETQSQSQNQNQRLVV